MVHSLCLLLVLSCISLLSPVLCIIKGRTDVKHFPVCASATLLLYLVNGRPDRSLWEVKRENKPSMFKPFFTLGGLLGVDFIHFTCIAPTGHIYNDSSFHQMTHRLREHHLLSLSLQPRSRRHLAIGIS